MTSPYRLSVVVGTFNRFQLLERCITSIGEQTRTPTRIYVADAGSTDGTVEWLTANASDFLVPVLAGRKLGQAKALNDVFAMVETRYVAWLSDDNIVVDRGLDTAVAILDRFPRTGMVALKVRDVQGPFVDAPYIGGISSIGVLNVNQGLTRTDLLRRVGGFSEAFGLYGIDPDLTAKVLYSGQDVVYTKQVAIHHFREWATDPHTPEGAAHKRRLERSLRMYREKYRGFGEGDRLWALKRRWWARCLAKLGPRFQIHSPRPVLGALPRDWNNIFKSRHISVLDPLLSLGKPFHLRQRVRRGQCPAKLPPDLDPAAFS